MIKRLPVFMTSEGSTETTALVNITNVLWVESGDPGSIIHLTDESKIKTPMTIEEIETLFEPSHSYSVDLSKEDTSWAVSV